MPNLWSVSIWISRLPSSSVERWLSGRFELRRVPQNVNISAPDSRLRVQIQTDPRYSAFVDGAVLPVAPVEDVLKGKVWALLDPERLASNGRKTWLKLRACWRSFQVCDLKFRRRF
jgi:hypothetical protein